MKKRIVTKTIAAVLTVVLAAMMAAPTLAGQSIDAMPQNEEGFDIASDSDASNNASGHGTSEREKGISGGAVLIASDSSARMKITVNGKEKESLSFYVYRDPENNEAIDPEPVVLGITQTEGGEDLGTVLVQTGVPENLEEGLKDKIEIEPLNGTYLEAGKTLEFKITFVVSDEMKKGRENIYNNGEKHFISIFCGEEEKRIPVYYGIDGQYSAYSADSVDQYDGIDFKDEDGGGSYKLAATIDLNEAEPPVIVVRHKFGVYADMTGVDEEGRPVGLAINNLRLNPDGDFVFPDGTLEMVPQMDEDGWISIPIQLKADVYSKVQDIAVKQNKKILGYYLLTDLVIGYNDGYITGGKMNPVPVVYAISYTPLADNQTDNGDDEDTGSGQDSSGVVQGIPEAAPRVTNSSSGDIGWVQQDGIWYYRNADNEIVTDWLLGLDGRWYFLGLGGAMKTGWMSLDGNWYFFNADGAMANGWVQGQNGKWYYLQQDGRMAMDMTTPDGYYVNREGVWVK